MGCCRRKWLWVAVVVRSHKVWQPGWSKADHATQPSAEYAYKISQTEANAVTTKALQQDGTYRTTFSLYDGLLRTRQTQAPATGTANSVLTETHYDTRGWAWKSYGSYYAAVAPSATLYTATSVNQIPSAAQNLFDGTGRVTDALSLKKGTEQWRTVTQDDGDRTTVIPPNGGTASTTITDAQGRKTELRQYTDAARTAYQSTKYAYGKYDEPATVTDPAGNIWTYTFDNRGQQVAVNDPDKGLTSLTYDDEGRPTSAKDARGITLTTVYDKLGRKTAVKNGSSTLTDWTYDTVAKGQLSSTTRYDAGAAYTTSTNGYTDRYQPTSSTLTVPSAAGPLAGTYSWSYGYDEETGALEWTLNPAVGDVPSERVTTVFVDGHLPYKTTAGALTLVNSTQYDTFDRPTRTEFGATLGKKVYKTQTYDEHTGRPTGQTLDRDMAPQRVDDTTWTYDPAGNITGTTTVSGQDADASTDRQCFTNDVLGRLTSAWTAKTDCASAPATGTVGGPDAYWLSYGYDKLGNRTTQTDQLAGAATTCTHPAPNTGLPHGVQQATVTGGPDNGRRRPDRRGPHRIRSLLPHLRPPGHGDDGDRPDHARRYPRKQLPFGELRTNQSSAFGPRGFVGGTNDPTGLTHLGAREYDPTLGRFLSVDPIIDNGDPAQMNAYSYAHNNPVTKSDPDGLRPDGPASYNDERWASDRGMSAGYTYKSGTWIWHQNPRKDYDSQQRYRAYRANPAHYKVYHYNAKAVAQAKAKAAQRAADVKKSWWEQHKRTIIHQAINFGVAFIAGTAAIAICAGTAGLGCIVAGAVVGAMVGTPAHLIADKAMGHETTGGEAVGYRVKSASSGAFQGGFRYENEGKSPLIVGGRLAWRGATATSRGIGQGVSAAGRGASRAVAAVRRGYSGG